MNVQRMKNVWSKAGWIRDEVTEADERSYERSKIKTIEKADFTFTGSTSDITPIQECNNEVMYGCVGLEIDKLPSVLRQITEKPDEWHIRGSQLYKAMDPINQVHEFGEWGAEASDADTDVLSERSSVSRMFLEAAQVITPLETTEAITDLLGSVSDGYTVEASPNGAREYVDVATLGVAGDVTFASEESGSDDVEAAFEYNDDDVILPSYTNSIQTAMPELPQENLDAIKRIKEEFEVKFAEATTLEQSELLKLEYEQALDNEVGSLLTNSLNSRYCAHGYSQPKSRWQYIDMQRTYDSTIAAEDRKEFFYRLFSDAGSCTSMDDLYGKWQEDDNGNKQRVGGFLAKIRKYYYEDSTLKAKWSMRDRTDEQGNVTEESAFTKARNEFIHKYREEEKDEETLRGALWAVFDRVATNIPAKYKNGKKVKDAKKYPDSYWRQRRTRALQELNLTAEQWNSIYQMVDVVRNRLKMEHDSADRVKSLDLLAKHFKRVDNLADLASYMKWAQKRKFLSRYEQTGWAGRTNGTFAKDKDGNKIPKLKSVPTFKFKPSVLDRVSILDEHKWRMSCAKKRRHLIGREVLHKQLREQVVSETVVNTEEPLFLNCTRPNCAAENGPSIGTGTLKFYEIQDGKGLYGMKCESCGEIIWQLGHKETPELKTLED